MDGPYFENPCSSQGVEQPTHLYGGAVSADNKNAA